VPVKAVVDGAMAGTWHADTVLHNTAYIRGPRIQKK